VEEIRLISFNNVPFLLRTFEDARLKTPFGKALERYPKIGTNVSRVIMNSEQLKIIQECCWWNSSRWGGGNRGMNVYSVASSVCNLFYYNWKFGLSFDYKKHIPPSTFGDSDMIAPEGMLLGWG
jgi:hypothetical protein